VPKAGVNVRQLALQRRKDAILRFIGTACLIAIPLLTLFIMPTTPGLVTLILIAFSIGAFILYKQGQDLWFLANRADQGASGEENVARILKVLEHQGWKMEYNVPLPHWGDADVFLRSSRSNYFVVDVKTNKGRVFFDGSVLKQRYGKKVHDFPNGKDLLRAVRGQAAAVRDLKKVSYVQPVLCFTRANLSELHNQELIMFMLSVPLTLSTCSNN
jgi:hypothetical protein